MRMVLRYVLRVKQWHRDALRSRLEFLPRVPRLTPTTRHHDAFFQIVAVPGGAGTATPLRSRRWLDDGRRDAFQP